MKRLNVGRMLRMLLLRTFLLLIGAAGFSSFAIAQVDPIEDYWYNEDKTAKVQIYRARDGKFYGKVAWLKKPTIDGKTKVDANNPDPRKRDRPILGLVVLKGFEKDDSDEYEEGTIYDPKNGKTYSCKMTLKGNVLDVRGYVGISMIGRSTTWVRAD